MDYIDAHRGAVGACGCCGHRASEAFLDEMTLALVERSALDYAGLEEIIRTETNNAPYVPHEISLTALLAENAADVADAVEPVLLRALAGSYVDAGAIQAAGASAASIWQNLAWPTTLEAKAGKTLSGAALVGAGSVPFGPLLSDFDRLRVVNGMVRSAKYATNNYFNTQVMPTLFDAANSAVLNGAANDASELEAIRAMLDRRLRSVPYWNLVANAAASRAYHHGYLKVGVAHYGANSEIEFYNPVDERTSPMCRALAGTRWPAGDVALLSDRIADAVDVDELKRISPWLKPADVAGLSPRELLNIGVVIPPIHGRCRSKLRFV